MRQHLLLSAIALTVSVQFYAQLTASAERDLAFEHKSLQWMNETRQVDEAIKSGKLAEAESILKSIISDRVNYNLDLSAERSALARVYALMGKNDQCEALLKINLKTREDQDGMKAYTLQFPLHEYADFLDSVKHQDVAKSLRERANAIELAAAKEGERQEKKQNKPKRNAR